MFIKLLREPLLHFLILGFLIFYLNSDDKFEDSKSIYISKSEITALSARWEKKNFRSPTEEELEKLITQKVYEKVMIHEALALGLDKDDHIINRRLMQKMEFIISDSVLLNEPSKADLLAYMNVNKERFSSREKISFILRNAELLPQRSIGLTHLDVAHTFGREFAKRVFSLDVGVWSQIESVYGTLDVFVQEKTASRLKNFTQIKNLLRAEYLEEIREELNIKMYNKLKRQYVIVIEK